MLHLRSQVLAGRWDVFVRSVLEPDNPECSPLNPESESLAFVPVLYTENGAHATDEAVTLDSLEQGVDWTQDFIRKL